MRTPPFFIVATLCLAACLPRLHAQTNDERLSNLRKVLANVHAQISVTVMYDPAYVDLKYPGGDVPADCGVCTDVAIRAFRAVGTDLQQLVHEDMKTHFVGLPASVRPLAC